MSKIYKVNKQVQVKGAKRVVDFDSGMLKYYRARSPRCDFIARLLRRKPMSVARGLEIIEYGVRFRMVACLPDAESNIWVGRGRKFIIKFGRDTLKQGKKHACEVLWHELVHAHVMFLHGQHGLCSMRVEKLIDREAGRVAKKSPLRFDQMHEVLVEPAALDYYRRRYGLRSAR